MENTDLVIVHYKDSVLSFSNDVAVYSDDLECSECVRFILMIKLILWCSDWTIGFGDKWHLEFYWKRPDDLYW